jgi:recombination protein U
MNYPNGIKKPQNVEISTKPVDYKNRGMTLEGEINQSNEYYIEIGKAFIYKKPTPIKIVNVDFPSKNKAVIKEAYFSTPSTTDYNGLYKGKYIDFEAKETKSKTAFALTNIHPHQIKHLENIDNNGGIAFIIVRFTTLNETYLITAERFLNYINNNDKKSVPLEYFKTDAYLIKDGYRPRIDYLKVVDILIGGKI